MNRHPFPTRRPLGIPRTVRAGPHPKVSRGLWGPTQVIVLQRCDLAFYLLVMFRHFLESFFEAHDGQGVLLDRLLVLGDLVLKAPFLGFLFFVEGLDGLLLQLDPPLHHDLGGQGWLVPPWAAAPTITTVTRPLRIHGHRAWSYLRAFACVLLPLRGTLLP